MRRNPSIRTEQCITVHRVIDWKCFDAFKHKLKSNFELAKRAAEKLRIIRLFVTFKWNWINLIAINSDAFNATSTGIEFHFAMIRRWIRRCELCVRAEAHFYFISIAFSFSLFLFHFLSIIAPSMECNDRLFASASLTTTTWNHKKLIAEQNKNQATTSVESNPFKTCVFIVVVVRERARQGKCIFSSFILFIFCRPNWISKQILKRRRMATEKRDHEPIESWVMNSSFGHCRRRLLCIFEFELCVVTRNVYRLRFRHNKTNVFLRHLFRCQLSPRSAIIHFNVFQITTTLSSVLCSFAIFTPFPRLFAYFLLFNLPFDVENEN